VAEKLVSRTTLGKVAAKVAGKLVLPLEAGLTGYTFGRAMQEGHKAYQASTEVKSLKKTSEAKYGSIEKAAATRRALYRK